MTIVNLTARTDVRSADAFRDLVIRERNGAVVRVGDIAEVELGADDYEVKVQLRGKDTTMISISVLPTANSLDVVKRVRAVWPDIAAQLPASIEGNIVYDFHGVHQRLDQRGDQDPPRGDAHRDHRDLPLPRFAALGRHPHRRDPALPRRRHGVHARHGFFDQPAHPARHGAGDRTRGRRCDRRRREHPPPHRGGADAAGRGLSRARTSWSAPSWR
jgi:hypothetical protein